MESILTVPDDLTWSIVKEILINAPVIFGALTVGEIIVVLTLAVLSYYLSIAAVNKYQQSIKDKMAGQKVCLVNT